MASLLFLALAHSNLAFDGLAKAAMAFFWLCTGVLARIALTSLPASSCPHHWHCASICRVGLQRSGRGHAGVCQYCACVFPALRWRHCQHRAVILVAGNTPASLPSSCGRFCPCCAGIVALVAFPLLPASRTGVCPVTKQSRHTLASLPTSRHCCCWRSANIVALVARVSLPLSCWRCCPWHTRVATSTTNWPLASHDAAATHCR